jgi:SAM-dependent methyltransferase
MLSAALVDAYAAQLDSMLGVEPWCIDDISYREGILEITGWAVPPEGRHADVTFSVNDQEFERIIYPLPRTDVAQVFWYKPGAALTAFKCQSTLTKDEAFADGYAVFKFLRKSSMSPVREEYNYYYPDDRDEPPMPSAGQRKRVSGGERAEGFRMEGFTTFKKLDLALQRTFRRGLSDFRNLLDWGCGCGRVTRYLQTVPELNITGIDIDAANISWCQQNLPRGNFQHVPLHPPVALESESFDVMVGISVFTHLKEHDQFEWLHELRRLAKPGAVLLMTVLGSAVVSRALYSPAIVRSWFGEGFIANENKDLTGYIEDDSYYVDTCLTSDYIQQNWSRVFDIVEIIPAYIGNQQDLIIMRKPG